MSCRATVFPTQPDFLWPALSELAKAARRGLGDCPAYAPFASPGGGCSNVDPSINADAYFKSGGQLADDGTVGASAGGAVVMELDCPYGSKLNPFTGRTECRLQAEAQYTTGSGYVIRTSSDAATMAAIAAAAQAEGRARGINITCKAIPLGGDLLNDNKQVYGTDCTANGSSGHDAAVLLTGSGFEILATELGLSPFFQKSAGYQYVPPTSQQQASVMRTATAPAQPASTAPAQPANSKTNVSPPASMTTTTAANVVADVSAIAEQAKAAVESAGLPSWIWYAAGAGAVGLYFLGGKRR